MENSAFNLLLLKRARKALACGPLNFNASDGPQVRFMAVEEHARGLGYGTRILDALETEARGRGARKIVFNARDNAAEFYRKRGYEIIGDAERLFWSDLSC